jgi:hypothetical protein
MNFRTGESKKIAEVHEDPVSGGCGPGEGYNEPTASTIKDFHLESRPDGLNDLVYHIETTDCKSHETTAKTLRFVPTGSGFAQE